MIVFLADNLEGGAARLAEDLILEWMTYADRSEAVLIHAGNVHAPDDPRLQKVCVTRRGFLTAYLRRCLFVWKQARNSVIYNFTNFPIAGLFCSGKRQITLLHNAYLVTFPEFIYGKFTLKERLRERSKHWIFRILLSVSRDTMFLVQTSWMKRQLDVLLDGRSERDRITACVIPQHRPRERVRCPAVDSAPIRSVDAVINSFWFYPAALYPHKNHGFVLDVADQLKKLRSQQKIVVTVPTSSPAGLQFWNNVQRRGLEDVVKNVGWISGDGAAAYLQASKGLFFPSSFESVGLPLLEAKAIQKPILATYTELNAEVTQGCASLFDLRHERSAEWVAQAMEAGEAEGLVKPEPTPQLSLLEAYILQHLPSNSA
jgi:glycosyltransferase involved in cell wall biosynthesis